MGDVLSFTDMSPNDEIIYVDDAIADVDHKVEDNNSYSVVFDFPNKRKNIIPFIKKYGMHY